MTKCFALIMLSVTSLWAYQGTVSEKPYHTVCVIPRGRVIKKVDPVYPPNAAAHGVGGKVIVAVSIDEDGEPEKIRVVKGNPIFTEAAITPLRQWRWVPFIVNGKAVPLEASVTVNFEPRRNKTENIDQR